MRTVQSFCMSIVDAPVEKEHNCPEGGKWRGLQERGTGPHSQHTLKAMAQDSRQELLKQVIMDQTRPVVAQCLRTPTHQSCRVQIEERKRLHAKLMEKVRDRSLRTRTAEVCPFHAT